MIMICYYTYFKGILIFQRDYNQQIHDFYGHFPVLKAQTVTVYQAGYPQ